MSAEHTNLLSTAADSHYPVPLVVGITGHRDLLSSELPLLHKKVREFFEGLRKQFPALPLQLISPLAEGADRLVAQEARALRIPLIVPLPMPRQIYIEDFANAESIAEFDDLCKDAEILELPLRSDVTAEMLRTSQEVRDQRYAELGVFVCAHSHILLAIWDGKAGEKLGGTAHVVKFHQTDIMPGLTAESEKPRLILVDDDSDLVYHIACSRDRADGSPAHPLLAGESCWRTSDDQSPRSADLPKRYKNIFDRTSEFNIDARKFHGRIEAEKYSLSEDDSPERNERSPKTLESAFVIADWLAIHYQQRFFRMLRVTHILAVLMGLAYILYSELFGNIYSLAAFLGLFILGVILFKLAENGAWQRKYLEYRALAEGLRVQFYWTAASVRSGDGTGFTHDRFLQKQDVELGWIRNVMRVAGRHIEIDPRPDEDRGLRWVIREWIGNVNELGQLRYYRKNAAKRERLNRITGFIGKACLLSGIAVAIFLVTYDERPTAGFGLLLNIMMGLLPLIAAVRIAYAHKKADKELIKQYQFMARIFANARKRIDATDDKHEQREILRALGDKALDEHADWILIHRERSIEISGL
ncbi:MAG: hypothetical protein E2O50_02465 [Gammaproteobacteria bacterium]|nr:MAG: hypothetical protein E2O50_02465 [Gammaproteobacteria bacterium]